MVVWVKPLGTHSSKAWGAGGNPVASGVALLDMMTPSKGGSTGMQMKYWTQKKFSITCVHLSLPNYPYLVIFLRIQKML